MLAVVLALFLQIPTQDDGYGTCPAFQHSHADAPGSCFLDENDGLAITVNGATDESVDSDDPPPEIKAALKANDDIEHKFHHIYRDPDYTLSRFESDKIAAVKADLEAIDKEEDHEEFLDESQKLKDDFDQLDAYDDMLRVSLII